MSEAVHIREMKKEDIGEVYVIEKNTYTSAWTRDILEHEVLHNQHGIYAVIEYEQQIVGYAGMWVVFDDAQITTIAIDPKFQGKKLGQQLFQYMLQTAHNLGVKHLSLEVRTSNVVAQNMYRKFGLVPGGLRKGYYTDNNEDAIVMWVRLT